MFCGICQKHTHTPFYHRYVIEGSPEWKRKCQQALTHYGYRCWLCGRIDWTGDSLDVHHLHYRTLGMEAMADLRVVCEGLCHSMADAYRVDRLVMPPRQSKSA